MTSLREQLDQIANSIDGGDALDGANLYRQSMERARRRRGWLVAAVAAAVVAAVAVAPSLGSTGGSPTNAPASSPASMEPSTPPGEDSCAVGEERSPYANAPGASVVLGCAQLGDQEVELLSMVRAEGLCLQIVGIDDMVRACGTAPSAQVPPVTRAVAAQAIAQRSGSAALEVYGAVSAEVTTVRLTYTVDESSRKVRAELIQVTDNETLEEAGIREPFGYFLAELPSPTSEVTAQALDAEGRTLGTNDFAPYLQTQPREAFISGPSR